MSDSDTEKILWCQGNPVLAEGELARAHTAREEWNTVNVDSRTVEGLAQDEIQSWVDAYGIDSDYCRPRVLGIPPRVSLSALFSAEQINEAMLREPPPSETWDPYPVIVSLDPAHLGTNSSCIVTRRGKNMRFMPPIRMTGQNATAVVNRLVQHVTLLRRAGHVVHVVLDQSGMGGPYVDMARERGLNVTGVLFGAVAMQPQRFRNRRAEMFWRLREYIAEGGCLPEDKELREELLAIGAWHDEAGRLQLEAKRDVLAKLGDPGRGIDAADACALSVAVDFALVEDDGAQERVRERRRRYDEDPYSLAGANEYDPVFGAVR
jgi:hypothetical protein